MKNPPGFSYGDYTGLLQAVKDAGYALIRFMDAAQTTGPRAIIRHDIDVSPTKALAMAEKEVAVGVRATYFTMLTSEIYNPFTTQNRHVLKAIWGMGHEIGLHFDASRYADIADDGLEAAILREMNILERIVGAEVKSVSWHIPWTGFLGRKLAFLKNRNINNAYDPEFFHGFRYVSDSTMRWRDSPLDILDVRKTPAIQILTHPIWYTDEGRTKKEILAEAAGECALTTARYLVSIDSGLLSG